MVALVRRSIGKRKPLFTCSHSPASPRPAPVSPRGVPLSRPCMPVRGDSGGRLAGLPPVAQRTTPAASSGRPRSSERQQPGPASAGGWVSGWGRGWGTGSERSWGAGTPLSVAQRVSYANNFRPITSRACLSHICVASSDTRSRTGPVSSKDPGTSHTRRAHLPELSPHARVVACCQRCSVYVAYRTGP
jgi:hypothetical protein